MKKIGVFVCHCGINISSTVDIEAVKKSLENYPGVELITDYKYMCSEPGQTLLKQKIKELKLDGVVVAACSPKLHEQTFRNASNSAGLNPFMCEIANIREQCSWVHEDKAEATEKAKLIIKSIIEKTQLDEKLEPIEISVTRKALVIGGAGEGHRPAPGLQGAGGRPQAGR